MQQHSYAGCLGLSPAILLQFILKMCAAAKNYGKFTKNPVFWVGRGSRSLKVATLINLKSPSPVLVMISSMYVPICNCFHIRRANSSKITTF